jgi:hypothetical protein
MTWYFVYWRDWRHKLVEEIDGVPVDCFVRISLLPLIARTRMLSRPLSLPSPVCPVKSTRFHSLFHAIRSCVRVPWDLLLLGYLARSRISLFLFSSILSVLCALASLLSVV